MKRSRIGVIGGVCGGIADELGIEPWIVRGLWLLLTFGIGSTGVIIYLIAWMVIPEE